MQKYLPNSILPGIFKWS